MRRGWFSSSHSPSCLRQMCLPVPLIGGANDLCSCSSALYFDHDNASVPCRREWFSVPCLWLEAHVNTRSECTPLCGPLCFGLLGLICPFLVRVALVAPRRPLTQAQVAFLVQLQSALAFPPPPPVIAFGPGHSDVWSVCCLSALMSLSTQSMYSLLTK